MRVLRKSAAVNTWLRSTTPATQKPESKACIDQFEFPDLPCDYPVVWVKAREAAQICWAVGERIADAHKWEGACEGDPQDHGLSVRSGARTDPAREFGDPRGTR